MGKGNRILRALLGAVVFGVLCVGILSHHATRMTGSPVLSTGNFDNWKFIGRGRHRLYHDSDLNFVIKRRVPNGPDPIHNRRASQARQPPGRI